MEHDGRGDGSKSLQDHIGVLRRRKWILLLAIIVVPVAAIVYSLTQETLYKASASVILSRQDPAASLAGLPDAVSAEDPRRFIDTQVTIARSLELAREVIAATNLSQTPFEFQGALLGLDDAGHRRHGLQLHSPDRRPGEPDRHRVRDPVHRLSPPARHRGARPRPRRPRGADHAAAQPGPRGIAPPRQPSREGPAAADPRGVDDLECQSRPCGRRAEAGTAAPGPQRHARRLARHPARRGPRLPA